MSSSSQEIKLVFLDMEGTVFKKDYSTNFGVVAPSAWAVIAKSLGEEALAVEKQLQIEWKNRGFSRYVEFVDDTVRNVHIPYGLTKSLFNSIINSVEYHEGVHYAIGVLHNAGIMTAMVTGGFKAQADRAGVDLGLKHWAAACDYFWNENGTIRHWNSMPYDEEGKVDFMRDVMREHGFSPDECAFVGDGKNDRHLAARVGYSISFNGQEELENVVSAIIRQPEGRENFMPVSDMILNKYRGVVTGSGGEKNGKIL